MKDVYFHGESHANEAGVFYCDCCDVHYRLAPCRLCQTAACYRCLKWLQTCRELGGTWCTLAHRKRQSACTHEAAPVAHQVPLQPDLFE